jgi:hypothetical protein
MSMILVSLLVWYMEAHIANSFTAPPSRPSSSNSNATNGSLRPSDTGTNGQSKPPQAQRPTAPRKKVDPFIRKKR